MYTRVPHADLKITNTDNFAGTSTAGKAVPGQQITYTVTVTNSGPSNVIGASVADTLPTGATFTAVGTGGAAGFTASGTGSSFADAGDVNLPAGSTVVYTVKVPIASSATGSLTNTATVTTPASATDTNSANNSATDTSTLTPQADLKDHRRRQPGWVQHH